jgi:hypothetical protein
MEISQWNFFVQLLHVKENYAHMLNGYIITPKILEYYLIFEVLVYWIT